VSERRELTMTVSLDRLPATGLPFRLTADAEALRALAERFELVALDRLEAEGRIDRIANVDGVRITGRLLADAVQSCVVTFEPVRATIDGPFERVFVRRTDGEGHDAVEVDPSLDEPEPLDSDELDVGEIVAEELSLALDPYPRSPAADRFIAELEGKDDTSGPFAALGQLRVH
jgi:uncharacterized metal-binding protein YceD (DUF177 family)